MSTKSTPTTEKTVLKREKSTQTSYAARRAQMVSPPLATSRPNFR